MDSSLIPDDAKQRASRFLKSVGGSVGSFPYVIVLTYLNFTQFIMTVIRSFVLASCYAYFILSRCL